jgi:hypothetical protein
MRNGIAVGAVGAVGGNMNAHALPTFPELSDAQICLTASQR